MTDPRDDFRVTIRRELGEAHEMIEPGRLHRFATRDRPGDDAGFCKLFDDLRGGVYGCNRQFPGQVFTWSGIDRDRLTPTERAAMFVDHDNNLDRAIDLAARLLVADAHSPPGKSEAPEAGGDGGPGQTETEHVIFEQVDEQRKRVARLTARAALLGLVLRQDDGAWCITKESSAAIPLASLQAAEALVFGCELVRAEIDDLVGRLAREQGVQA